MSIGWPHTRVGRAGVVLAALASLALSAHWLHEVVAVDSCLDAGHVYDYARERCETSALVLPVTPYAQRHATLVLVASGLIVTGLVAAIATRALGSGSWELSFSAGMALLVMALAVWAVPGWGRLVLLAPLIAGVGWALFRLRRSG
jgi:hypothetical protein